QAQVHDPRPLCPRHERRSTTAHGSAHRTRTRRDARYRRAPVMMETPGTPGGGEEPILITPEMLAPRRVTAPARPSDGRIDFERRMRKAPPVVLTLIVVNVAVFVWEVAAGAFLDRKALIESGVTLANYVNPIDAGALA